MSEPIVYRVDGMTCGGCARSVGNAVKTAAPTVEVVHVDPAKGTLEVRGAHDPSVLREAIEDAGFDWAGPA